MGYRYEKINSYFRFLLIVFFVFYNTILHAATASISYTYDNLNRLTKTKYSIVDGDETIYRYILDEIGNITRYDCIKNVPFLLGDIDLSEVNDLSDVILSLQVSGGVFPQKFIDVEREATADQLIGVSDAIYNLQVIAGLIDPDNGEEEIPPGVIAYYQFDGNADDYFGQYNGAANGIEYAPGVSGSAADFDGVSDTVLLPDKDMLNHQNFSIGVSIKYPGNYFPIVNQWTGGTTQDNLVFVVTSDNKLYFNTRGPSHSLHHTYSDLTVSPDVWHFVGIAYDAATGSGTFYVDGSKEPFSTGLTSRNINTSANVELGVVRSTNDSYAEGLIDNLYFFSRRLTDEEMQSLR